mgnify:FL=1
MKVIDLLNIWVEDRNKLPKKIKVEEKIFEYHEAGNLYITPNGNYFLISSYLDCAERLDREVEIIEGNEEIEEKLDWEEIIDSVGKPLWDNKKKIWRVLDSYYREGDSFKISFSDENNFERFENQELYFEEREEK